MGMAKNTRKRGREQAGMSREGRRTMEKVLENTVRDNGQLYVALSRATSSKNICILLPTDPTSENSNTKTLNIVYPEVLL